MAFTQVLPTHRNLVDRLVDGSSKGRAITFVTAPGGPQRVGWDEIHADAKSMAAAFQARGVGQGHQVAILGPTSRQLVTAIQATWLAGAAVVVLPLPMRLGSLDQFVEATRTRITNAQSSLVVIDPDLAAFVDSRPGDPPMVSFHDLAPGKPWYPGPGAYVRPEIDPESLAILQFTSGSTAEPKGVMLPHDTLCHNLDAIVVAGGIDTEAEVCVSWLPLYHDMGLIGLFTLPMTLGLETVLAAPQDFVAAPGRWMQWMSDYKGTATAGPNFSYALAARALPRMEGLDLSPWRLGLNGAEPVDPVTVEKFLAAGAPHGLDPRMAFCAFGMAEACLAVTFPQPFTEMRTDCVDRQVLETNRYAAPTDAAQPNARRFAMLGTAVPGLELRIVDTADGALMGEREVGELQIRGTSITPGYFNRPDATAATFDGDWLKTGDLAYQVDGQLVVCGRIKDVIIVGGRNVFPEDVERAVGLVEGIRAGNVIAFGVEHSGSGLHRRRSDPPGRSGRQGREGVVVVAESRSDDQSTVRLSISKLVRETIGFAPSDVVLVEPGTLPKTSSGKLQRSLCRTQYETESLSVLRT
jgi:fatty-acyl-CoA synthase